MKTYNLYKSYLSIQDYFNLLLCIFCIKFIKPLNSMKNIALEKGNRVERAKRVSKYRARRGEL